MLLETEQSEVTRSCFVRGSESTSAEVSLAAPGPRLCHFHK